MDDVESESASSPKVCFLTTANRVIRRSTPFAATALVLLSVSVSQAQVITLDDDEDKIQLSKIRVSQELAERIDPGAHRILAGEVAALDEFRRHADALDRHTLERAAMSVFRNRRNASLQNPELKHNGFNYWKDWRDNSTQRVGMPVALTGYVSPTDVTAIPTDDRDDGTARVLARVRILGQPSQVVIVDARLSRIPENEFAVIVGGIFVKLVEDTRGVDSPPLPYVVAPRLTPIGIEIDDQVLEPIEQRTRIQSTERRAYYRILLQAKLLTNLALAQAARETAAYRLQHHARLIAEQYPKLIAAADELAKDPSNRTKAARQKQLAESYRQQQGDMHQRWVAQPESYRPFLDSIIDPYYFTGKPITLKGRVRDVRTFPPDDDIFGLGVLYEIWLFPEDGQSNPAVVVCTELPDGFPLEGDVVEHVSVTGYYFKLHAYQAGDTTRITPMLLAKTVSWKPIEDEPWPAWASWGLGGAILLSFGGIIVLVRNSARADRDFQKRRLVGTQDSEPDFSTDEPPSS